ncbi:CRISPR-associated helicase Cas3' [uncultured Porphyromonas sp.]|uniref:CRISPR-associated helicase Cas3' n=1 Tax=uncultured Porphyromonas sp. TaxID=159274 RepID=UPI0026124B68|nr:CRISPR-associated helicase Cas3' [uncultured Porphyromonas sp.]
MSNTEQIAHVRALEDGSYETQPLLDHLHGVAEMAQSYAERITDYPELGEIGYLLGLLHDLGKYQAGFQRYIRQQSGLDPTLNGWRTPHSPAGARYAYDLKHVGGNQLLLKILSLCIGAHHRGLYDDSEWRGQVVEPRDTERAVADLVQGLQPEASQLEELLHKASLDKVATVWNELDEDDYQLLVRMLFSCLVDADFLDTERFMTPDKSFARQNAKASLKEMRAQLEEYVSHFNREGRINEARAAFLDQCRNHGRTAQRKIYSLTLPTGAGKTVSSMMWALEHAIAKGCERIIYVIPYTSIITQTAQTFRDIFGADQVLEHHSDVDIKERPDEAMEYTKLMTENWDVPLIVTTNVQFFESLYAHRVSRCRKLHNICNSVVVFDEVQMFPPRLLNPILRVVESLHYAFRVEPLFCTATLPVFDEDILSDTNRIGHEFFFLEEPIQEVVPYDAKLFAPFDKVRYHWDPLRLSTEELAERLTKHESFLCIVNSRNDAARLYTALQAQDKSGEGLIHLSRRMCSAHIQERIEEIRRRLKAGEPVRVVSTQLVEAGVDLDFPVVYRAMAGLDSVMQAAGRCNREGRMAEPGEVYIFSLTDGTNALGEMSWAQGALEDLLNRLAQQGAPQREEIERYYKAFYNDVDCFDNKKDKEVSKRLWGEDNDRCEELRFDYETASEFFRYIEDQSTAIVVPYGKEGKAIVKKLQSNLPLTRQEYRQMNRLTVSLYEKDCLTLGSSISVSESGIAYLTNDKLYSSETGIQIIDQTLIFMGV